MERLKNKEVLNNFLRRNWDAVNYSDNLRTYTILCNNEYIQVLKNYNALIAYIKADCNGYATLYINKKYLHYSNTTQKHINYIVNNYNSIIYQNITDEEEEKILNTQAI